MFERGCAIRLGAGGEEGQGPLGARTAQRAPRPLDTGLRAGGSGPSEQRARPGNPRAPPAGGRDQGGQEDGRLLSLPAAPACHDESAPRSSKGRARWTWMASNPFLSMRPVSFLLPPPTAPRLLGDTRTPGPRSPSLTLTAGGAPAERRGGGGCGQQEPRGARGCLVGPCAAEYARMCSPASRGVSAAPGCAPLPPPPHPSALQSCPHSCSLEQKQPLVSLHCFAPSGFLLLESPG